MEECHPRGPVGGVLAVLVHLGVFVEEVESLREPEKHDAVDDAEREHVTGDHLVDHHHERTGELEGAGGKMSMSGHW